MGNICSILVSKDGKCVEEYVAWAEEAKIKDICKSKRRHLNFLLNSDGCFQVLTFYTDNILRGWVLCVRRPSKSCWLLSQKMNRKGSGSFNFYCLCRMSRNKCPGTVVTPLHLEWEPTMVHFNSCRRWTEKNLMMTVSEVLIQYFLSV